MVGNKLIQETDREVLHNNRAMPLRANRPVGTSLREYYVFSVALGIRSFIGPVVRDAIARIINPLSYPRLIEFSSVMLRLNLQLDVPMTVLDIGSPKLPFLLLAHQTCVTLYSTDIRPYFIKSARYFLERLGHADELERRLYLEVQDARSLTYPEAMFDRIFAISVIEHIPLSGDTEAMREISRVLKPGGLVSLTVPFAADGYRETFVDGDVYEREQVAAEPVFYERHYDEAALHERLIGPSGLRLVAIDYFGEPGFKFERYWNRIPMRWKIPLLWMQPFIARQFLKPLPASAAQHAVGVCITLCKD
jgi:SAM-dependent methyltransferase